MKLIEVTEDEAIVRFGKTQRGRSMLMHLGYQYVENRQSLKNTFWRCSRYLLTTILSTKNFNKIISRYVKFGCRASAVTPKNADDVIIRVSERAHSHPPEKVSRSVKCDEMRVYMLSPTKSLTFENDDSP